MLLSLAMSLHQTRPAHVHRVAVLYLLVVQGSHRGSTLLETYLSARITPSQSELTTVKWVITFNLAWRVMGLYSPYNVSCYDCALCFCSICYNCIIPTAVPAMPDCGSVPVYDSNDQLVSIETNWTAVVVSGVF